MPMTNDQHNPADEQLWRRAGVPDCAQATACPGQLGLASYLDGRLSADEIAKTEAHFAECGACRETVADARLIAAAMREQANTHGRPSLIHRWRLVRWPVAAAASIAICVVGYRAGVAYAGTTDSLPDQLASQMTFGVFDLSGEDSGELELIAAVLTEKPR